MTRARDLSKFANSQAFSVDSDFQVGINSTVPAATLDVRGDSVITGVLTATSFSGTVDATGLTGTPDITVNNIVGAAATFSGVVTYEDVTNVDSVGVITARSDVSIADKIIHTGDTNTAIRFPQADTFSVETGGTEAYRVDSSRRILLGHTSSRAIGHASGDGKLQIEGTNLGTSELSIVRNSDNNGAAHIFIGKSRGSSVGDSTVVQDDDTLGIIGFAGADGTDLQTRAAQIECAVDGTPGGNDMPGRLVFSTTADGASSVTERLRIDSGGQVLINGGNDARSNFHGGGTTYRLQVESTSFETSAPAFICNSNTAGHGPHVTLARSRGTSVGSNTIVQDDDVVGVINFQGNDGTHFENVARIRAEIDGTPGANDMPGRLTFFTVADGSVSPTERVRIDSSGNVVIGATDAESFKFKVTNGAGLLGRFTDGTSQTLDIRQASGGIELQNPNNGFVSIKGSSAERLRIDASGNHILGHTSAIGNMKFGGSGDFGSHSYVVGANKGFANGLAILNYDATATIPALLKLATSRSDTNGTNTAVGDNDNCGGIEFMGNDGTRFIDVARIDGVTDGSPGTNDMPGRLMFLTTADGASVVTERMRITSTGKVRIKCADYDADPSASNAGLQLFDTSGGSITSAGSGTGGESHFVILNTNGVVGQIQSSGSGTTYATSSDYRLKENVVDLTGAIARVKQLAPKRFNFIADDTTMVDGFLAHEAQTVVPEAVTGTHNEVDGDGNPVIQGIDQAKLVPLLTAALKEAITKIETLETKVAALEAE